MAKKALSDPHLKKLFNRYNRRYWGGTLPRSTVVRWASGAEILKACDDGSKRAPIGLFFYDERTPTILLHATMKTLGWWSVAKQTLHHEMSHLSSKGRDSHGPAFDGRMYELAGKGAFHRIW